MDIYVGIIGCGGIARGKHLPALQHAGVKIAGFYDTYRASAERAAADFGTEARVYDTVEALLQDDRIQVVHICTPNISHASLAIQALNAGKHVMCEKPMATNAADAQAMLDAAKRNHRKLTIGYQGRFRREAMHLKKMCDNGELGDIYFARAHALRRRGIPNWGTYLDSSLQGGGCLIDIGTHSIDLVLWLMNNYEPDYVVGNTYRKIVDRPSDANAWGRWDAQKIDVEDAAFAFLRMKNGATVELECSWALNCQTPNENKATLAGTLAGADLLDGLTINGEAYGHLYTQKVDVTNLCGTDMDLPFSETPADAEIGSWIDAIRNDTDPIVLSEQAVVVSRILEAIYQSAETGKPVYF